MLTFDDFTITPQYSDIESRSQVNISTTISDITSDLPIINSNMLAICTPEMIIKLINDYNTFASYHRFFESDEIRKAKLLQIQKVIKEERRNKFFISIGTKKEEYDFVEWLIDNHFTSIIIDVNHGHHKMVADMLKYIKTKFQDTTVMSGNVSTTSGIKFLADNGADIIKVGNSGGSVCSTRTMTSVYVHSFHAVKQYRDDTKDNNTCLIVDGGVRDVSDIAKSLIYANAAMLGKMMAGCNESYGTKVDTNGASFKEFYGNASAKTKQSVTEDGHISHVEGVTKLIPCTGPMKNILKDIREGLQSAFSFVGARNVQEYKENVQKSILMI